MTRKNVHIDDLIARGVRAVRHAARYPSETEAINRLLAGAVEEIEERSGYVYLARSEPSGLLKIGHSENPAARMKQLAAAEGGPVTLLHTLFGSRLLETAAHVRWASLWVRGEWFVDEPEIRDWFKEHPQIVDDVAPTGRRVVKPIRLTSDEVQLIDQATEALGTTYSSFARSLLLTEARRVLRSLRYR